jgi:hypothetical protein
VPLDDPLPDVPELLADAPLLDAPPVEPLLELDPLLDPLEPPDPPLDPLDPLEPLLAPPAEEPVSTPLLLEVPPELESATLSAPASAMWSVEPPHPASSANGAESRARMRGLDIGCSVLDMAYRIDPEDCMRTFAKRAPFPIAASEQRCARPSVPVATTGSRSARHLGTCKDAVYSHRAPSCAYRVLSESERAEPGPVY